MIDFLAVPFILIAHNDAGYDARMWDGTQLTVRWPYAAIVTLPAPSVSARCEAERQKQEALADWWRRREQAVAMKLATPKRSIASIAREMRLAPSSLSKWVKQTNAAAK